MGSEKNMAKLKFVKIKQGNGKETLHASYTDIVSSRVGTPPFQRESSLSGNPPLSEANQKSYPPLSESHPNWCM